MRGAGIAAAAAVALAACGGGAEVPERPAPRTNLTVEGARAYVLGELQRFYGRDADPHIARLASRVVPLAGTRAFRLEVTAGFTRRGDLDTERWTFWVGIGEDAEPRVLRSDGPHPAAEGGAASLGGGEPGRDGAHAPRVR